MSPRILIICGRPLECKQWYFPIRDSPHYEKFIFPDTQCVLQCVDFVNKLFNIQISSYTCCVNMHTRISKDLKLTTLTTLVTEINCLGPWQNSHARTDVVLHQERFHVPRIQFCIHQLLPLSVDFHGLPNPLNVYMLDLHLLQLSQPHSWH